MGTCYNHLTFTDRLQIEAWQKAKIKPAEMAEMLGVHLSTIYRELKRGVYTHLNSDLTEEERYSRYEIIRIMKDHTAASVIKALNGIERLYGADFYKIFQTITIDNGSEFSDYEGL